MKNPKLLKCPFCPKSFVSLEQNDDFESKEKYYICCGCCGSQSPKFTTKKGAIKFWNTRIIPRHDHSCPICNTIVLINRFKINQIIESYWWQYKCTKCGFQTGISKDKKQIDQLWETKNE